MALVGRDAELLRIETLLHDARRGEGSALVIEGEAGVGKSVLLEHARRSADAMTVLEARGVPTESDLAFAALQSVVGPVLDHLPELPDAQRHALAGSVGLVAPGPHDRFAVGAGTLALLSRVAEEQPCLTVVDDAHWIDRSSAQALAFAARRMHADAIALLFAVRTEEPIGFDAPDLPHLTLRGIDAMASGELLSRVHGRRPAPTVAEQLHRATGGNPLALIELSDQLSASQLSGREPLPYPLPAGAQLGAALGRRIDALPTSTRRALVVVAASESGASLEVTGALDAMAIDPRALEAAEAAGVISADRGAISFRHPLLRSAAYHASSAADRRAAHGALAVALAGESVADRRAWHLAAASPGPDESIAEELDEAALRASARGAPSSAAGAYALAARLSTTADRRVRRLLRAAEQHQLLGQTPTALRLAEEALAATDDPIERAEVEHLRAQLAFMVDPIERTRSVLESHAARAEDAAPGRAAMMLSDLALIHAMAGEPRPSLAAARRSHAAGARAGGPPAVVGTLILGTILIMCGEAAEGMPLLLEAEPLALTADLSPALQLAVGFAQACMYAEDYDRAEAVVARLVSLGRTQSAPGALPYPLATSAEIAFRRGDWLAARAHATESVELARETGQRVELAYSLTCLAHVEAGETREDDCRRHLDEASELSRSLAIGSLQFIGDAIRGLLYLGLGDFHEAALRLEICGETARVTGLGEPGVFPWGAELVESQLRSGNEDGARASLAFFRGLAERTARRGALEGVARCDGLLAADEGFDGHFERALALSRSAFERARTELCFAERLRRVRRRREARPLLRHALQTFERLGAVAWAARARSELVATGERLSAPVGRALAHQLTPKELQVARIIATGATNREAAAALFLSPRTVEAHLDHIYRKLDLRSRSELAHRFGLEEPGADPAQS
jgi:DNA-binding CsgD family transcriptional regulator